MAKWTQPPIFKVRSNHKRRGRTTSQSDTPMVALLKKIDEARNPVELPSPAEFANIPSSDSVAFGKDLAKLRQLKAQAQAKAEGLHLNHNSKLSKDGTTTQSAHRFDQLPHRRSLSLGFHFTLTCRSVVSRKRPRIRC